MKSRKTLSFENVQPFMSLESKSLRRARASGASHSNGSKSSTPSGYCSHPAVVGRLAPCAVFAAVATFGRAEDELGVGAFCDIAVSTDFLATSTGIMAFVVARNAVLHVENGSSQISLMTLVQEHICPVVRLRKRHCFNAITESKPVMVALLRGRCLSYV